MALESKTNVLVSRYTRRQLPNMDASIQMYIQEELQRIEASINQIADATIQVADNEPETKRKGMVRYAVSPWDPLGNSYEGLVVYNGTAWVQV
jgi:hypothetical protein